MATKESVVPSFRRNGKRPSCEPCRKSKYSCDHATPICGRCQRRGIASQCSYHPAPMRGLTPSKKHGVKRAERSPSLDSDHDRPQPARQSNEQNPVRAFSNQGPGFLGSTSYNAVLEESQDHIELATDLASSQSSVPLLSDITNARGQTRKLKEAIAVLEMLYDFPHLDRLVTRWGLSDRCLSIIGAFANSCSDAIRSHVIEAGALENESSKTAFAEQLFLNTARKMHATESTRLNDYFQFYSGASIRWECLGAFFTACGLCCNSLICDDRELDFVGHREEDRQNLMYRLLDASNACVSFCEDAGQLSDFGMWLTLENCVYASQVLGDAHYLVWRKVGDMSTAIFAQGLHQDCKGTADLPFWLAEMRRRALGTAYAVDKLLCTFVGRPPRISQRYCTINPPLDLEFSELALEGPELEAALSNIDENGWNKMGKGRRSVFQRCFVLNALLREEVLELSLGPFQENMMEKSIDLIRRSHQLLDSVPEYIRYSEDMWMSKDPVEAFLAAQEHLDILYNEFMIRRMMVGRLGDDPTELVHLAHKILSTVLESSQIRGARGHNVGCVPWIIVLYGLPTAGVLALELLQQKQFQLRSDHRDHPPRRQAFPSSRIIQELSVFISSLKYVHAPGDGNYALTEQARKSLQRILDKVLTMDTAGQRMSVPDSAHLPSPISNSSALAGDNGSGMMYDFNWMDNAQIDADFWMNLPDHPLLS